MSRRAGNPVATAILFPGGNGVYGAMRQNFLVRIVPDLVRLGVSVVVVDAPSDQAGGMSWPFREGVEHARDIGAVIDFAKTRWPAPVWLIGTSAGTISAANGAVAAGTRIHGLILTSSVWAGGMAAVALEKIVVPELIVHNRDDNRPKPVRRGQPRHGAADGRTGSAVPAGLGRGFAQQRLPGAIAARLSGDRAGCGAVNGRVDQDAQKMQSRCGGTGVAKWMA
jgi:pimeloyl-ACP methyl ester carboxylesterase